ncbi:hypothetical protein L1987_37092 [Smallanthus sonchifolius]|uniref:Uncharacterized protein n=1 Tax=Smallanthus sonchifolius TaxID=185202 RepID=A0ACB9HFD5_9ASTR|nr:hypothetical protein L1987_37092 [Smallanthus sonchifolius]
MDFTPPSRSNPPIPIQANPISSIPSSRKLPIKRKTPNSTLILTTPKLESTAPDDDDDDTAGYARHPPFKFHRIWTEPDEIRLLQGLLDSSSQGLSFPRDLGLFYAQFANGMSQPYSKSQLSEKLRRLRKKFRVISSRLSTGLDKSLLSPQDRALYDLSKQLWDPDRLCLPFGATNSNRKPNLVAAEVSFSPELPSSSTAVLALPSVVKKTNNSDNDNKINKLEGSFKDNLNGNYGRYVKVDNNNDNDNDVNVESVPNVGDGLSSGIVHFASKTLAGVLDRSLKEIRVMIDVRRCSNLDKEIGFEKRWRDQHVAEFDVLAKRLKLILEHSSMSGK